MSSRKGPPGGAGRGARPWGPRVGDMVLGGKYRIEKVLGEGGMGVVMGAQHVALGRKVAFKFLKPAEPSASAPERFLREARAVARLDSEHVVRVSDVGVLESGVAYMLMERLEGEDLDRLVRRVGPLPVERAVLYALQACDAVACAHAVGIIHRDLKPANLFLARGPEGESMIKVLDFGISKSIEQLPHGRTQSLTDVGAVLGSPRYMAPEQVRDIRHVDVRADLWSLGVVLYELLVGAPMFRGSTVEVLGVLLADDPLPRVRVARSEVSEELDAVLTRCMRRAPAERIASATELSLALAPFGPPEAASLVLRAARRLGARGAGLTAGLAPEAPNPYDIINRPSALVAVKTALPPAAAAPALRRASLGGLVALGLLALVALASLGAGLSRSHPVPTSASSSMLVSSAEGPSGGALLSADLDAEGEPAPAGSLAPPLPSDAPPGACAPLAESSATPPRATSSPRATKRASELDAGVLLHRR